MLWTFEKAETSAALPISGVQTEVISSKARKAESLNQEFLNQMFCRGFMVFCRKFKTPF